MDIKLCISLYYLEMYFLNDKGYEEMRREYFIRDLTPNEVNQSMRDIKWLFREYKGLDVITIENKKGDITKFIL